MSRRLTLSMGVLLFSLLSCTQVFAQGVDPGGPSTGKGGNALKDEEMVCLFKKEVKYICKRKYYDFTFQARPLSEGCDKINIVTEWVDVSPYTGKKVYVDDTKIHDVVGSDWQTFTGFIGVGDAHLENLVFSVYAPASKSNFEIKDAQIKMSCVDDLSVSDFGENSEGSLYGLNCSYTDVPGYSVSKEFIWYKNSVDTDDPDGWVKVGTGEKLTFAQLGPDDEGFYRVVMKDNNGDDSFGPCAVMSESFKVAIDYCGSCDTTYTTLFADTVCEGQKYTGHGFTVNSANSGTADFVQNELSVCGCDSIVRLQLTGLPSSNTTQLLWLENGDTVSYAGETFTKPGTYFQNTVTDSVCEKRMIVVRKKQGVSLCDSLDIVPDKVLVLGDDNLGRWHIGGIENFPRTKVSIYNRNGRLLWEGVNYNDESGWDGTYHGNPLPSTDYWFVISSEECDRVQVGHFTLLRDSR